MKDWRTSVITKNRSTMAFANQRLRVLYTYRQLIGFKLTWLPNGNNCWTDLTTVPQLKMWMADFGSEQPLHSYQRYPLATTFINRFALVEQTANSETCSSSGAKPSPFETNTSTLLISFSGISTAAE
jgi:hypothetical protein